MTSMYGDGMQKIPTVFVRDPENRAQVTPTVTPGCEWVLVGEGTATRKYDGTACLVRGGKLYKRREVKHDRPLPDGFLAVQVDSDARKTVGWVPVTDGPEDAYHREAWDRQQGLDDGTYELVGPKVQDNPEGFSVHNFIRLGADVIEGLPLDFEGLREWLTDSHFEGIVWHHPDGRMAKLKRRDFPR